MTDFPALLTRTLELLGGNFSEDAVLEAGGRGAAGVGGEVGLRGEPAGQPRQLAVADQLVAGDAEGPEARSGAEGAAPQRRDVVVLQCAVEQGRVSLSSQFVSHGTTFFGTSSVLNDHCDLNDTFINIFRLCFNIPNILLLTESRGKTGPRELPRRYILKRFRPLD